MPVVADTDLVARFGDSYRAYMERTGRFVPSMPNRRDAAASVQPGSR